MPIYNVVTGQAVIHDDLRSNTLCTGWGKDPANVVRSGSVVILVNERTGRGGLYHYPAGPLDWEHLGGEPASRKEANAASEQKSVIDALIREIEPNKVVVYAGIFPGLCLTSASPASRETQHRAEQAGAPSLARYLSARGLKPNLMNCEHFGACVTIVDDAAVFSDRAPAITEKVIDLSQQAAGRTGEIRIIGANRN